MGLKLESDFEIFTVGLISIVVLVTIGIWFWFEMGMREVKDSCILHCDHHEACVAACLGL